jgi:hypothetical protein
LSTIRQALDREFAFDAVFGDRAEQAGVYERSARPLVADFINGRA